MERKDFQLLFRRLDELEDHIGRIRTFVERCINDGKTKPEDIEGIFNDEIYTEMAQVKDSILSMSATIVEHLLKLKYCTNNWNHQQWSETVDRCQDKVSMLIRYNSSDVDANYLKHLTEKMDYVYKWGVDAYHSAVKKYPDLKDNEHFIPSSCPWNVDDLLTDSIDNLMSMLPDPDTLTVQMQLSRNCKYYNHPDKIKGVFCENCDFYAECLTEYYDHD